MADNKDTVFEVQLVAFKLENEEFAVNIKRFVKC